MKGDDDTVFIIASSLTTYMFIHLFVISGNTEWAHYALSPYGPIQEMARASKKCWLNTTPTTFLESAWCIPLEKEEEGNDK